MFIYLCIHVYYYPRLPAICGRTPIGNTAPQHLVCRVVPSLHINHMQMSIIEVFICRRLHMNTSMIHGIQCNTLNMICSILPNPSLQCVYRTSVICCLEQRPTPPSPPFTNTPTPNINCVRTLHSDNYVFH